MVYKLILEEYIKNQIQFDEMMCHIMQRIEDVEQKLQDTNLSFEEKTFLRQTNDYMWELNDKIVQDSRDLLPHLPCEISTAIVNFVNKLSEAEMELFTELGINYAFTKDIAKNICKSKRTVEKQLQNIMLKLSKDKVLSKAFIKEKASSCYGYSYSPLKNLSKIWKVIKMSSFLSDNL